MRPGLRVWCFSIAVAVMAAAAVAQDFSNGIVANQNRIPAGKLENGVFTLQLEIRDGVWRPEAEDGPQLFVPAFAEAGHPGQIPGPLMRMPEGTTVHVNVANKLKTKATVYGLNTRPGDPTAGIELAAGESRELSFPSGAPGTYYYWARTSEVAKRGEKTITQPLFADSQMNGAFIVDPRGEVPPDRIFVINAMFALADVVHETFEVVSINGKSFPFTEPLEYMKGETIRWRVINPSFGEHPMHLHGAFYKVLSWGDFESDKTYVESDQQSVVTQDLLAGHTMMLEWRPEHVGRWLFHCHFQTHISLDERVPVFRRIASSVQNSHDLASVPHDPDNAMSAMSDMAGLVLLINIRAATASPPEPTVASPHKIDLVIEPTAASGKLPSFTCSVREGKKIVASEDKAMGPPIVVTRGEPTEITVLNHLDGPTTIHWHGLELDSYYDGVIGGGTGSQVTPVIAPGANFTARFTPNRAGTFIYHTHADDPKQLSGGIYGPLIVLEPREKFDLETDRVFVVGARDTSFYAKRITLNGAEDPSPLMFKRGVKYRLRIINIAPNLAADLQLGSKEHPAKWRAVAKDGAALPSRLAQASDATLHIVSGETYDFEFQPDTGGEMMLQAENVLNNAKVAEKIVVH